MLKGEKVMLLMVQGGDGGDGDYSCGVVTEGNKLVGKDCCCCSWLIV